jgi:hypothetical protein
MRIYIVGLLLAVLLAATNRTFAGPANLLQNPGFETGSLAPWFAEAGSTMVTSPEGIHSGSFGLTAPFGATIRQNFAATPVSEITHISFYIDNALFEPAQVWLTYYYDDATSFEFFLSADSGDFKFARVDQYLEPGKNLNGFSSRTASVRGTVYMDDFLIIAPEPSSFLLALIASCFVLRRPLRRAF